MQFCLSLQTNIESTVAELKYHTILISNSDLANLTKIYWVLEILH